ncbi:MAG: L-threonylcarbamoyladenylate synthase, partial [Nannocystaceae bacterium]
MGAKTPVRQADAGAIREAAALVRAGQLVGFPTETVYGLGALALDPAAVARIFVAKGRPPDNPLIVHLASQEQLESVASAMSDTGQRLAD